MSILLTRSHSNFDEDPTISADGIEEEHGEDGSLESPKAEEPSQEAQLQTFVFSATLSKDLQRNLKKRSSYKKSKNSSSTLGITLVTDRLYEIDASHLDDLLMKLDFRDPEPEVIDLSPEGGVVSTLKESQIECLSADKVCI